MTVDITNTKEAESLFKAILGLRTTLEAKSFFRDLLTENELRKFANRWQAAQMLADNIPYSRIVKETGLSSTTVARISKWLNEGMGGYKLMISRLHHPALSSHRKGIR